MKKRRLIHMYLTEEDNEIEIRKYLDQQLDYDEIVDNWIYLLNKSYYEMNDNLKDIFLSIIKEYKAEGKIQEILIIEKAKYIDNKYIKEIKKYGVKNIEIKAYSSNSYILSQVEEEDFKQVIQAVKKLNFRRFKVFLEMQIGLPESNELDEYHTAKAIAKLKPYLVKIRPTLVFKDTILETKHENNEYKPLSIEEAVEQTKKLIIYLQSKKIPEIQVGFDEYDQLFTNITKEKQDKSLRISQTALFIDGPYDENYNFYVYSALYYEKILEIIKKYNMKVKKIEIDVHPSIVKFVAGDKDKNLNNLKRIYDIDTKINQSLKMSSQDIKIKILESYTDFLDE